MQRCQKSYEASRGLLVILLVLYACSVSAQAQVTSLTMTGDAGDYIGGGQFYFYTPADGAFGAQQNSSQGVSLSFSTPSFDHWWYLDFAAPNSQLLTVGTYLGATRFPFQASSEPGLSVYGDGRGCNMLTGSFQVLQVTYGSGTDIIAFDALFEQHCEGAVAALRGEIRYNANVVVNLTAPTRLTAIQNQNVNFMVTATDGQSRHVVLTASGLPSGATFIDNGNNTGTFNWTPTSAQAGSFLVTFLGNDLQAPVGAAYTQVTVIPPPPPNDDFANAAVVPSIPFTVSEFATNATTAPDDPFCVSANQTVWFSFTPNTNIRIEANTFGSNYDTTLSVYTGLRGGLNQLGCDDDAGGTVASRVRFDAVAGTTYYFMVSSLYPVSSANLVFNVLQAPPPLSIAPTIAQFGSVNPTTGVATVNGSVTCSQPTFVNISGQLKQMHAGSALTGFFSAFVPCNGTAAWNAVVQTQPALFHGRSVLLFVGGKANVAGSAFAFDPDTGEFVQRNFSVDITLRGAH
jgi:hypothetical protein